MKRILCLLLLTMTLALHAEEHLLTVNPQVKTDTTQHLFTSVNEALVYAQRYSGDTLWTEVRIAPGVYWIDDPDDDEVRRPLPGDNTPYGLKVCLSRTRLTGTTGHAEDVVLACNRGQTQGAMGNYTMMHITGDDVVAENITFGNYCNVDLVYPRDPRQNRARRADAIVQAQLILCQGDRYRARNCRFISRLNLCPFAGARHADFQDCYFECTDDALCGTGTYRHCRFTLYSSKPFYSTSPQGALLEDCDIHSRVKGTQYLTKVSSPITLRRCRWTSDDPNLQIQWTRKPNPRHRCLMEDCTLNGKPLDLPPTPDVPMPVTTPTLALSPSPIIAPGRWTVDAHKPFDTQAYGWSVPVHLDAHNPQSDAQSTRPDARSSWAFGEGVDGAEGCFGLVPTLRGARLMYTGLPNEQYEGQKLTLQLAPCKSAGQGFGSATGQYMDICLKFDTRTLTGYGLRFIRTPQYDHAVEICLVEYTDGQITPITQPAECRLFKRGCQVTLTARGTQLDANITLGSLTQRLTATMPHPNAFGGIHIQHTGTTGASGTVIQSIHCTYE